MTVRYPASWHTSQAEQEGVWYRTFLAPPTGPQRKPAVSVTLLVGRLGGSLNEYAQTYLAGNALASTRDEVRQGARGKSYLFASPDGATRHSLLLLEESGRVYGLFAQGEAPLFESHYPILEEMARSLTLEHPSAYPEQRNERLGFSIRVPPSWRSTRSLSGRGSFLLQFTSPPLAADPNNQTVHASLTLTVEPIPGDGSLETFYKKTLGKLGEAYQILSHVPWEGGYADVMRAETPLAVSRVKRFYRASQGRGYCLSFEAREDVYAGISGWWDIIAKTLKTGPEVSQP